MFVHVPGSTAPGSQLLHENEDGKLYDRQEYLELKPPRLYEEAVSLLIGYQKRIGKGKESLPFNDGQPLPLMVITGQQPLLLTGPMFTFYKALTACRVAQQLAKEFNRPVIPLFWVATEDHDLFEAGKCYLPSSHGGPHKLTLRDVSHGLSLGEMSLQEKHITQVVEELARFLPADAGYKNDLLDIVWEEGIRSKDLGEWFTRLLTFFLGKNKILFFDPFPGVAKGIYRDLLREVWQKQEEIGSALAEGEKELMKLGAPLQVKRKGQETLLMITVHGKRRALCKKGECCFTGDGEFHFSSPEIEELIMKAPFLFTPNVLLRPIFQDHLFPTICYVTGPGEWAYGQQIKYLYHVFGLEPPLLISRSSVTLIEKELAQLAKKWQLSLSDIIKNKSLEDTSRLPKKAKKEILRHLFPKKKPQERVSNFSYFWANYGPSAWSSFIDNFPQHPSHYLYYW